MNQSSQMVSVVMAAYQAEEIIEQSVRSIIKQSHQNWELKIVDDFSYDNTKKICENFCNSDSRIKYIKLDKNYGGPAHPRNIGIKNAKGEIIAFCDSDDIWDPMKLEIQLKLYDIYPINDVLICSNRIKFNDFSSFQFENKNEIKTRMLDLSEVLRSNGIILSSVMVAKSIIKECNYFNEDKKLIAVEDYDMWLKMIQNGKKIVLLKNSLIGYRLHNNSLSANKMQRLKKFRQVYINFYKRSQHVFLKNFKANLRVLLYASLLLIKKLVK